MSEKGTVNKGEQEGQGWEEELADVKSVKSQTFAAAPIKLVSFLALAAVWAHCVDTAPSLTIGGSFTLVYV